MQGKLNAMSSFDKDIYVVSQCASDFAPNRQILIQDAFVYFERNYCNLSSSLGTPSIIYDAINKQISNLSNLPQLMNVDLFTPLEFNHFFHYLFTLITLYAILASSNLPFVGSTSWLVAKGPIRTRHNFFSSTVCSETTA